MRARRALVLVVVLVAAAATIGPAAADPILGAPAAPKKFWHSLRWEVAGGYVVDPQAPSVDLAVAKILHPYVDLGLRSELVFADGVTVVDSGAELRVFDLRSSGGTGYNGPNSGFKGRLHWFGGAPYIAGGIGYAVADGEGAFSWRAGGGFDRSFNGWLAAFVEGGYTGGTDAGSAFVRAGVRM